MIKDIKLGNKEVKKAIIGGKTIFERYVPPATFFPLSNTAEDPVSSSYREHTYTFVPFEGLYFDEPPTSFFNLFSLMRPSTRILDQDLENWDVSNITNMNRMFFNNGGFNSDISSWDVSNVTNMGSMFFDNQKFNQDISGWDVSNVTDMSSMFYQTFNFKVDISSWDVSNVTNMGSMFYNKRRYDVDLSQWCVTKIPTKPSSFNSSTGVNFVEPVWGTCPRGEDQL